MVSLQLFHLDSFYHNTADIDYINFGFDEKVKISGDIINPINYENKVEFILRKALIVCGGWTGHEPEQVSEIFKKMLEEMGFVDEISRSLDVYLDTEKMNSLSLIVTQWTMGEITEEQCKGVTEAVDSGVGIAGTHGGMCDAYRQNTTWQFMTGGQWVAHPGNDGIEFEVNIGKQKNNILAGIEDFKIKTEHYYLHVDPAVKVLATTLFPIAEGGHTSNGKVKMPVAWTKRWGKGKVFYNALGHLANVFDNKSALEMTKRGFEWAARKEDI